MKRDARALAETWRTKGTIRALWQRDASVWTGSDESKWLGWLDVVAREQEKEQAARYAAFSGWAKSKAFTDVVVLGMGGSSLGPEVLAETFGQIAGFPKLRILDSTRSRAGPQDGSSHHARQDVVHRVEQIRRHHRTQRADGIFLCARRHKGWRTVCSRHRPGSSLEKVATARGFAQIFHGEPTIGGRYSVLSPFGLVPAAAAGFDIAEFLALAATMVRSCGPDVPPAE